MKSDERILFTGDSITDCGRVREDSEHLGFGYAAFIAARLQARLASPKLKIFNRGISGNRVRDLWARREADLMALQPTVVSILIGINDVWRRYDSGDATEVEAFKADYNRLLFTVRQSLTTRIILLEPFLLHVPDDRYKWREDLNPKIDAIRELAVEYGTELIPLDGFFAQKATQAPAAYWAGDGVHPSAAGHAAIADAWLEHVGVD
jgi:acyl-CoA thioesterase-1